MTKSRSSRLLQRNAPALPLLILGLSLLPAQFILSQGHLRQALLFIILWIIPGWLWSLWLTGPLVERFVGGAGLALFAPLLFVLGASYIPGPLSPSILACVLLLALLAPFLARTFWPFDDSLSEKEQRWHRTAFAGLGLIMGLTVLLRLLNIDYKEFQGDEGVIMVRAAQALLGDEMGLLRHQKGPVEILVPLIPWGLGGSMSELWARLPFTWAGILAVGAIAATGARAFDRAGGLLAALLFTMGGFAIAFSRIVQYQSFVMLWSLLSLLFAYRYSRSGAAADLVVSSVFLAGGLLAHYDAILFAPAVAWCVLWRWRRQPYAWRRHALAAFLFGGVPLALFYIPYLANPTFGGTGSYLINDRLGGNLFTWSGPEVWRMATFYNSTYYVLLLMLLAVIGATAHARRSTRYAILLFTVSPLLFYTLIVADPRTHIYTFFPGLTLLAGVGTADLWRRVRSGRLQWAGPAVFVALAAMSLWYVILLFVDVTPERQRTWQENRPKYFPTTWTEPPLYGLFGFPHQAGWRRAPALVTELPYTSNEEAEITNWYMAQAPRTHCPDYQTLLIAARAQDAVPYDSERADRMSRKSIITVNGQPALTVLHDEPGGEATSVEATGSEVWRTPQEIVPPQYTGDVVVGKVFDGRVKLSGYTLDRRVVSPGETVTLVLFWQALAPIERNYQVLVHLYDGTMWAQDDGAPDCAMQPTSGWEPGDTIRDAHQLAIPSEAPSMSIPLYVGMYDLLTGDRMTIDDTGADVLQLGVIEIGNP